MTSSHSPAPLVLELRPSLRHAWGIALGVLLAAAGVIAVLPAQPWLAVLLPLLAAWAWRARRRRLAAAGWLRFEAGQWWWRRDEGAAWQPLRLRRSLCWPWLVLLELDDGRRRHHQLVFADSCDAEDNRRLRVLLRHAPVFG